ncbi:MAG TPA: HNH endonuclease [Nitrososphaerales archaeon]|nr:HNH endonuclease [Nitrososphaerales archaeon]
MSLVFHRDKGICRLCNLPVDPLDFDIGHNTAFAKGGKLNLQNAILLHPRCNRSMQKLNLKEARTVLGLPETQEEQAKKVLNTLGMNQLRYLAKQNFVKLKSRVEEGFWSDRTVRPSKRQFVNALAKTLSADNVKSQIASMPKPERRKRRAKKKSFWSF